MIERPRRLAVVVTLFFVMVVIVVRPLSEWRRERGAGATAGDGPPAADAPGQRADA